MRTFLFRKHFLCLLLALIILVAGGNMPEKFWWPRLILYAIGGGLSGFALNMAYWAGIDEGNKRASRAWRRS